MTTVKLPAVAKRNLTSKVGPERKVATGEANLSGAIEKVKGNVTPGKLKDLDRRRILFEEAVAENLTRQRFILDQEFHFSILGLTDNDEKIAS